MKKKIHPKYYQKATISCACGNVFNTGATQEKMEVEICSACHPFYTGKKKLVDSTGQVDRFKKIMEKTKALKKKAALKKSKVSEKKTKTANGKKRKLKNSKNS